MKLPSPVEHRLLSISESLPSDGIGIGESYENSTGDRIPDGTLYTTMRRMVQRRWLAKSAKTGDRRCRVYTVTNAGRAALSASRKFHKDLAEF